LPTEHVADAGRSTPQVSLRAAQAADSNEIAEIWHLGWQDGHLGLVPQELLVVRTEASFRTRASELISDATVAIVDGAVAGFVMVVDDEVEQVFVAAAHRGTGVANALVSEAERQVKASGHRKAWLAVVAGNTRARAFYERAGWVDEGPFDYAAAAEEGAPCRRYTKVAHAVEAHELVHAYRSHRRTRSSRGWRAPPAGTCTRTGRSRSCNAS
jgi:ribosomal protein S18 acetylase RimI-like enzyme